MKFILEVTPYDAGDILDVPQECSAFVIEADQAYAKSLLERMNLVKKEWSKDRDVYSLCCWDYSGDYYELDDENSCPDRHEGEIAYKGEPARMECNQVIIRADDVCWKAIPKHTSMYVLSDSVHRTQLEAIANAVQQA